MSTLVTAARIKELRDRTGVGMGDCKKALEAADGDMEAAIDSLRKKGMASAVKKEGRLTNEGMILAEEKDGIVAVIEVNAETDFVVRNERFQQFLRQLLDQLIATQPKSLEDFMGQQSSATPGMTVDQHRATIVQVIGENIQVRRIDVNKKAADHSVGIYSHMGGKLVVIVVLEGAAGEEALARDIAMHAAAAAPEYLSPAEVPADIVEREKEVARGQVAGKPANIIEKIVDGKINAFYDGCCLLRQKFIKDDSLSIEQLVAQRSKEIGKPLTVKRFLRWGVGS
jgi:elongation factor Ts